MPFFQKLVARAMKGVERACTSSIGDDTNMDVTSPHLICSSEWNESVLLLAYADGTTNNF
jgi:hypothetical protein